MFSLPYAKPVLEVTPERLLGKDAQPRNPPASSTRTNDSTGPVPPLKSGGAKGLVLPCSVLRFKPLDLPALSQQNPVFGTKSAAAFLAVSEEVLKKWRARFKPPSKVAASGTAD
jgi:hypothetical protein